MKKKKVYDNHCIIDMNSRATKKAIWACKKFIETGELQFLDIAKKYAWSQINMNYEPLEYY